MPKISALQRWFERRYAPWIDFSRSNADSAVAEAFRQEFDRQTMHVNLIASESLPSLPVMIASAFPGYVQTVEGTPNNRWFPGTTGIDTLELAVESRSKSLFGFPAANVQPHSATQANQAVYLGTLRPGDTILAMAFQSGGHLSHGFGASLARSLYRIETYTVASFSDSLDLEELEKKIREVRPHLIVAGCSAYPREIPFGAIAMLAKKYESHLLADISHTAGMVAAKLHGPVCDADFASMSLHKTMCGPRGGILLTQAYLRDAIDRGVFPGVQGALFPQLMTAKAVCLQAADSQPFRDLQKQIMENARAMAEVFLNERVALFTGGTDTQMLILRLPVSGSATMVANKLQRTGFLTNANYIVADERGKGMSGIRLGTTWISQLGFRADHSRRLAGLIVEAMHTEANDEALQLQLMNLVEEVIC